MKCQSCQEEISPKFSHAIATNSCPFCGSELMSQKLRDILTTLKETFSEAEEYMDQVYDWLSSNLQLHRVGDNQLVVDKDKINEMQFTFNSGGNGIGKGNSVKRSGEMGEAAQPQTAFARRAGMGTVKHKKDIDFILGQSGGAADPSEFVGTDDYGESVEIEDAQPLERHEAVGLNNLFGAPDPVLELEKLKRIQKQDYSTFGGSAKINRE